MSGNALRCAQRALPGAGGRLRAGSRPARSDRGVPGWHRDGRRAARIRLDEPERARCGFSQSRPNPRGGSTLSSLARSSAQLAASFCASTDSPRLSGRCRATPGTHPEGRAGCVPHPASTSFIHSPGRIRRIRSRASYGEGPYRATDVSVGHMTVLMPCLVSVSIVSSSHRQGGKVNELPSRRPDHYERCRRLPLRRTFIDRRFDAGGEEGFE